MQNRLSEKNRRALINPGAKRILADLANLNPSNNPNNLEEGQAFIDRYGELGQGRDALHVLTWAQKFRLAWDAKNDLRKAAAVNHFLDEVFKVDPTLSNLDERPAIAADFIAGKWEPQPRYLLDYLGLQLMRSRKMLHRCERPECHHYMIKGFSRDRYCSVPCAEEMRRRGQTQWAVEHKDEIKQRRRRRRKK